MGEELKNLGECVDLLKTLFQQTRDRPKIVRNYAALVSSKEGVVKMSKLVQEDLESFEEEVKKILKNVISKKPIIPNFEDMVEDAKEIIISDIKTTKKEIKKQMPNKEDEKVLEKYKSFWGTTARMLLNLSRSSYLPNGTLLQSLFIISASYKKALSDHETLLFGVKELLELKSGQRKRFSESWAIATLHLTALEIALNEKLRNGKFPLPSNEKEWGRVAFKKRLNLFFGAFTRDKDFEENILPAFWNLRGKVVHNGHAPNSKDLELIKRKSLELIQLIKKSRKIRKS